jgi:hypothetical protein
MRALVLAAAIAALMATTAGAADICAPTEQEGSLVAETMTRVRDPDLAALGAGQPSVAGCGVWSLEVAADGHVKTAQPMRLQGDEALRGVVEPWLKNLRFQARTEDWTGIIPVTLENSGKK